MPCLFAWFHEPFPNHAAAHTEPHNQLIPCPVYGLPARLKENIHIVLLLNSQRHGIKLGFTQALNTNKQFRCRECWGSIKMLWKIEGGLSFEVISNYVLIFLKIKNMWCKKIITADPYKMRDWNLILPTHTPEVNRFINNFNIFQGNTKVDKHRWGKQIQRDRSFYNALCSWFLHLNISTQRNLSL